MFSTLTPCPPTFEAFMAEHNIAPDHPTLGNWRALWERERAIEDHAPTVIPPCPSWCILDSGHEYTSTDGYGDDVSFERQHIAFEGETVASVDATEHNKSGVITFDEPSIYLSQRDDGYSAEHVRAVAAEMLAAADVLDRIKAATRPCLGSTGHEPHDWPSMVAGEDWHCPGVAQADAR
jgi:hypothetical protein